MPALENDKHELFCNEYLIDLNATQAYIRAGYSENGAAVSAYKLLINANIQERIAEMMADRSRRTEITIDMVVKELASIGFSKIDDFVSVSEFERESPNPLDNDEETFEPVITKVKYVDIKTTESIVVDKIRAISSIKQGQSGIEIKLHDKVKALELLGRHLVMFTDKIETEDKTVPDLNKLSAEDKLAYLELQKKLRG